MQERHPGSPRRTVRAALVRAALIALMSGAPGLCAPLQPPAAHDGSPGGQGKASRPGEQQRDPDIPSVQIPAPGLAPETRDQGQRNSAQSSNNGADGNWQKITGWITAGAALASFAVSGALLFVGIATLRVYRTQAEIMRDTREVAVAALGRPYVFFEFVSHNFDEWREGKANLWFTFRLANYGTAPAVIHLVAAYAFLSRGLSAREGDEETNVIKAFPTSEELPASIAYSSSVYVRKEGFEGTDVKISYENVKEIDMGVFIIKPKQPSKLYGTAVPTSPLTKSEYSGMLDQHEAYLYEVTSPNATFNKGWVSPWLVGRVVYEDTFGNSYYTSFCVRAYHDGSASAQGSPPYNERT